jgi:hypothetical protein
MFVSLTIKNYFIMTTVLIILGTLLVLLLLVGLLSSKDLAIEKNITINKPVGEVFNYLKFVKNHDHFSEWAMAVPDRKKEYKGADGQVGFVYAWDSGKDKNVGAGEQEIKHLVEGKSIEHELRFIRPRQGVAKATFTFSTPSQGQTQVQWGFYSEMKFPGTIMKPVIKNFLGKNTEKGLQNLKAVMEK